MRRKYIKRDVVDQTPEPIKRVCLKCDRVFMAQGRFNRICPRCHITNQGIPDVARYKVMYFQEEARG